MHYYKICLVCFALGALSLGYASAQEQEHKGLLAVGISSLDYEADLKGLRPSGGDKQPDTKYDDTIGALDVEIWFNRQGNRYFTADISLIDADVKGVSNESKGADTTAFSLGVGMAFVSPSENGLRPFVKFGLKYSSIEVEGDRLTDARGTCEDSLDRSLCERLASADQFGFNAAIGFDYKKLRVFYGGTTGSDISSSGVGIALVFPI